MLESQHKFPVNIHQPENLLFVFDRTFRLLKQKYESVQKKYVLGTNTYLLNLEIFNSLQMDWACLVW